MKSLALCVVLAVVALPCAYAGPEEAAAAFQAAAKDHPIITDALDAVRAATTTAAPTAAQTCVTQARNATLFDDSCASILTQLSTWGQSVAGASGSFTQANIDSVCQDRCFQRFLNFVHAWSACLTANNVASTPSTGLLNPTTTGNVAGLATNATAGFGFDTGLMSPMVDLIQSISLLFCMKNEAGNYCLLQFQSMSNTANLNSAATLCPMLTSVGCCYGAYVNAVSQIVNAMSGSTSGAAEMTNAFNTVQQQAKDQCNGLVLPATCNPTAAKMTGIAKLTLLWDWWNSQTADKQALIKTALCTDLAAAGGFYASQCSVTGVTQTTGGRRLLTDSTAFNYQVTGVSVTALQGSQAALNSNVAYNDVSTASGTTVTGTSTVSSIGSASSDASTVAGSAVVAMAVAAVAAVVAL